ncbi:MAG TPA: WYL domain-containing protein [bacterium]|nr:WYL domain-containing protein [bacterium]
MASTRGPSEGKHKGETLAALRNAFDILSMVQTGADWTPTRLAEELRLHPRQIGRYLDVLEDFGVAFAPDEDGGRAQPLRIISAVRHPPFNVLFLTEDELVLLYAHLAGVHSAGNGEARERLWHKVRQSIAAVPVNHSRIAGALRTFGKAYKSYEAPERRASVATLLEALYRNRTCQVTYRTPNGDPRTYRIAPYELVEFDGGLYVYSWVPSHENAIVQAVERIEHIQLNDDEFRREAGVEQAIRHMQESAFGIFDDGKPLHVTLRFSPGVAFYVAERTWHPTQQFTSHDDGSLTMTFTASGHIEIERWIRGWGDEVTVVEIAEAGPTAGGSPAAVRPLGDQG